MTYGSLVMALDSLDLLFRAPCIPLIAGLSGAQVKLLPGIELLRQLVNNFFLKWQKIQPIFHLATWKFVKTPLALLGAMACIGALLDEDDETAHQAHIISSRCVAVFNVMVSAGRPARPLKMSLPLLTLARPSSLLRMVQTSGS